MWWQYCTFLFSIRPFQALGFTNIHELFQLGFPIGEFFFLRQNVCPVVLKWRLFDCALIVLSIGFLGQTLGLYFWTVIVIVSEPHHFDAVPDPAPGWQNYAAPVPVS
jgi:hypothetical protein